MLVGLLCALSSAAWPLVGVGQITFLQGVSPVCATAASEVDRVKDKPFDATFTHKGDLPVDLFSHYFALLRSASCNCAAAESLLISTGGFGQKPDAGQSEVVVAQRKLARENLALAECNEPPDLVIATNFCPPESQTALLSKSIKTAVQAATDPLIAPLLRDAVVHSGCVAGNQARIGVWRKPYGNLSALSNSPGLEETDLLRFAIHIPSASLRDLIRDAAPAVDARLQENLMSLRTDDAQSIHTSFTGTATPGAGEASTRLAVDLRFANSESQVLEIGATFTDSLRIETQEQIEDFVSEVVRNVNRPDKPPPDRSSLQCTTATTVERSIDLGRLAEALFIVPTFGPGIAGGIDWYTDREFAKLASGMGAGAICSIVKNVSTRMPDKNVVYLLNFYRAVADDTGVHVYGTIDAAQKMPVAWIDFPFSFAGRFLAPSQPAKWITANSRDMFEPKYNWNFVAGHKATPEEESSQCGTRPRESNSICAAPSADGVIWVTLTASETAAATQQASYFKSATNSVTCSSLGCKGSQ
jgi:hypothetical protein